MDGSIAVRRLEYADEVAKAKPTARKKRDARLFMIVNHTEENAYPKL